MRSSKYTVEFIAFCIFLFSFICPGLLNAENLRIFLPSGWTAPPNVEIVKKGILEVSVVGASDLTQFRAWLNGREVTRAFDTVQPRHKQHREWLRKARLGASDGLVYGMNQLEVEVTSEAGESIKHNRTFEVDDDRPLVGAGTDRIVRLGNSIRLDGSDSVSTAPLRHRWKIHRAPRSSKAQLLDGDTPTPLLEPDMPGTYEMRLKVSDGNHQSGWDTVTLHATALPLTVSLKTRTGKNKRLGIQVGDAFYPIPVGFAGIQALILNRSTLEMTDDECPAKKQKGNCLVFTHELVALQKIIKKLDRWEKLVILVLPPDHLLSTVEQAKTFNDIVEAVGGESIPTDLLIKKDPATAVAVVGVPGFSAGQGYQVQRSAPLHHDSVPRLEGVLMLNANAEFWAFSWTDYIPFTVNIGKPGEITFGGRVWPANWDGRGGGFHVVMLDPVTLAEDLDFTFLTNGPKGKEFQGLLCSDLTNFGLKSGHVALIASLGAPFAGDSNNFDDLNCIVEAIQGLGGTAHVVTQLKSGKGYALAARGVRPNQAAFEASDVITLPGAPSPMKAQLTGVLGLSRQGWYEPVAGDATGELSFELFEIAFQNPTPWPNSSTPGEQGALCYITQQLGISGTQDVRSLYPDTQGFKPDVGSLNDVMFPSNPTCGAHNFTEENFKAVKDQLVIEFGHVLTIRNFFSNVLKTPFKGSKTITEIVQLNVIADNIIKDVQPSGTDELVTNILDIVQGVFQMISAIIPVIPGDPGGEGEGEGGAAATGVISSLIVMGEGIAQLAGTGEPADRIRAKRDQLETALVNSTKANLATFDRFQEMIVSDWGKMRTVAGKALDPKEWLFTDEDLEKAIAAYDRGAKSHFWSALMRTFYQRFEILPDQQYTPITHERIVGNRGGNIIRYGWQINCCIIFPFFPFGESHDLGSQWFYTGFVQDTNGDVVLVEQLNTWLVMPPGGSVGRWCTDTAEAPHLALVEKIHKLPEDGPGLYMPWFWMTFEWFQLKSWFPSDFDAYPNCEAVPAISQ